MSGRHIEDCFQKSIITSDSLLLGIWDDKMFYLHIINDFVRHTSHDVSSIPFHEIRRIHQTNAKCSHSQLKLDTCPNQDTGHENRCMGNVILNDSTSLYDKVKMFKSPWSPDAVLTDHMLDTFAIPRGNKRRRLDKFYQQSHIVYNYVCYCLGSEYIIKLRRWFQQKKFSYEIENNRTLEISGSKSEGLDMKGSDVDIMVINGFAYESTTDTANTTDDTCLTFNSVLSNVPPGYVIIEYQDKSKRVLFSSSLFKQIIAAFISSFNINFNMSNHGPALSTSSWGEDCDMVPSLKSHSWPQIANEWIVRKRKFGWPSQEMINSIVQQGCHIVAVCSKDGSNNENEWRLSFSLAEKLLIFAFNHTQILVYGLLKLILKEIINQEKEVSELLCSYFMKTTLFWVIEETHTSVWEPRYFILCFHLCIERLIQFIVDENCPNYFVRMNNMLNGKFVIKQSKQKLLKMLCSYFETGFNWIFQSETMMRCSLFLNNPSELHRLKQLQNIQDIIIISKGILDLRSIFQQIAARVFVLKRKHLQIRLKSLLKIPILRCCLPQVVSYYLDSNNICFNFKKQYTLQKLQIVMLCKGCREDLSTGKLSLASWLYNCKKYKESLEAIDLAFRHLQYRVFNVGTNITTKWPKQIIATTDYITGINFIQNLHHYSTFDIIVCANSCLVANELTRMFLLMKKGNGKYTQSQVYQLSILPETYCHFLKSLCLLRLGRLHESKESRLAMQNVSNIGMELREMNLQDVNLTLLDLILNMLMTRTDIQWKNQTNSIPELLQNVLVKEMFPNVFISEMLPNISISELNHFLRINSTNYQDVINTYVDKKTLHSMALSGINPDFYKTLFTSCTLL